MQLMACHQAWRKRAERIWLPSSSEWYSPLVEVIQAIYAWSIRQLFNLPQGLGIADTKTWIPRMVGSQSMVLTTLVCHSIWWHMKQVQPTGPPQPSVLIGLSLDLKKKRSAHDIAIYWWRYTPLVEVNQAFIAWSFRQLPFQLERGQMFEYKIGTWPGSHVNLNQKFINTVTVPKVNNPLDSIRG